MANGQDLLDLASLESFVIDNDELHELETLIGRFNIFDALRLERAEIRHSNFLAWLLNPAETHGLGALFLRAILMDMLRAAKSAGIEIGISPVEFDGEGLAGVEIRREWRNIDLLIVCDHPKLVVCIENKMHSNESEEKLGRYAMAVREQYPDSKHLLVFLHPDGSSEPSEEWIPYGYDRIHRTLDRVRRRHSLGGDVAVVLEHYLSLIGTQFMKSEQIEALCKKIYGNHRRAIDLIVEHCGTNASVVIQAVESAAKEAETGWLIFGVRSTMLKLVPQDWVGRLVNADGDALPPAHCSLFVEFQAYDNTLKARIIAGPAKDVVRRRELLVDMTNPDNPFGFRRAKSNKLTDTWTRVLSKNILEWEEDESPDEGEIAKRVREFLLTVSPKLALVPEFLSKHASNTSPPTK